MRNTREWGLAKDTQTSAVLVPCGILQLRPLSETTDNAQYIIMDNTSRFPVSIKKGDTVAIFQHLVADTFDIAKEDAPTPPDAIDYESMHPAEIDKLLEDMPHTNELSIRTEQGPLTADEWHRVKCLAVRRNRIWRPPEGEPKDCSNAPNISCTITLEKEFKGQGGVIPMNPIQRNAFNKIIHEHLDQRVLEKSGAGVSSTAFLVPKPGGTAFRMVQDYRALNKCI
jgi:hypothetical protein